jgi:hypothetical protein
MTNNGLSHIVPDLPDLPPGSPIEAEWDTFRRELPRLLAEGHHGRYALVKGDHVAGVWDTQRDALQAGYEKFGLVTFMVQPILAVDPPKRIRGYSGV